MTTVTQAAGGARKPGWILAIVSLGVVLSSLDLFVVNIALPSIAADLHSGNVSELSWILDAHAAGAARRVRDLAAAILRSADFSGRNA